MWGRHTYPRKFRNCGETCRDRIPILRPCLLSYVSSVVRFEQTPDTRELEWIGWGIWAKGYRDRYQTDEIPPNSTGCPDRQDRSAVDTSGLIRRVRPPLSSRRDFDFGIAAGCGCLNSFYDSLEVDPKLWPLLPAEYHDCDFSAGEILLVAQVLVRGQQKLKTGLFRGRQ